MTDTFHTDFDDDMRLYWNQLRAIDLCRAVGSGNGSAADALIAEVAADDEPIHLVAGLAHIAGSLCRTLAELHPTATEAQIWAALADRSRTGLHATRELRRMLDTPTTHEGEDNA